jgi:general secretion pathway protein A
MKFVGNRKDTERYIRHRLGVAGGAPKLSFRAGAFRSIWRYSKGYPRLINLICDRALLAGYAERTFAITPRLIRKAALSLPGAESAGRMAFFGWLRQMMPFLLPAVLLLSALLFVLLRVK